MQEQSGRKALRVWGGLQLSAELKNQQITGSRRKELLGAERTGIPSWERVSGGFLRDSKISRNPDDAGRNCWEQSGQEFLRGKGYREGFCGTRKSAETRTMPEGIAGSRADRNSFVGKGIGRVFAGLKIGE